LDGDQQFPVKGDSLSTEQILGSAQRARPFIGGSIFLVRLAPVDYHRVHYAPSAKIATKRNGSTQRAVAAAN